MQVIVQLNKKKEVCLQVDQAITLEQFKIEFLKKTNISIHRQCFKLDASAKDKKMVVLDDNTMSLEAYGVKNQTKLLFKDFGPQISYRLVFVAEYFGPIMIMLMYALRPEFIYGKQAKAVQFHSTAYLGIVCWILHFVKRELETLFVHRFSRPTMPLLNLFKNCSYYWLFAAVIGYPLCHPKYTSPTSQVQIVAGLTLFTVSEVLNFVVHLQLRFMRPKEGSLERPVPKGPLFSLVSCPNYTLEVLGWVGFSVFTQIFFGYVFTLFGFLQMTEWAVKKHRNYLRSHGESYKMLKRKSIVPFLI